MRATHRALRHAFSIDGNEEGLAMLDRLFECFRIPPDDDSHESPAASYRLVLEDGVSEAWIDSHEPRRAGRSEVTSLLMTAVNRAAMLSVPHLDVVHAGVVALGEATIVLPAHSGSGKSTMTSALTDHGFTYLSDELAPIDRHSTVAAFPKPIVVGRNSMDVLVDLRSADVGPDPSSFWFLDPSQLRGGRAPAGELRRVTHVVLPRYEATVRPTLRSLTAGEVAAALFVTSFNLDRRGRPGLDRLADLSLGVTGLALEHGDARRAAEVLASGVAS